jgi:ABC-2 type transport system ATP-binding protein
MTDDGTAGKPGPGEEPTGSEPTGTVPAGGEPEIERAPGGLPPVFAPGDPGPEPPGPARRTSLERGRGPRAGRRTRRIHGPVFRSTDDRVEPIRTRALTKAYGSLVAVDHLDLEVRPGEIYGLLGQNGAGKTTTILMLLGLTEPTEGEVRVVGLDPARDPLGVKRRVGYLPDAVGFYGGLTGRQNLRYTARLNGLPPSDAERRMDEVLDLVGLAGRADDRAETYSRGMLQRLGIADALLKGPDVLILDEPTTAIDPLGVVEILELLRSLAHDQGIAILLSSHLLNQVQSTCDRIGIFAAGRLIGHGTVAELAGQFGFPLDDLEIALDVPTEESEQVAGILRSVPGVLEVTVEHGIRDERAWMLRTDGASDLATVTRGVLDAIGDRPVVRIGRRRVELDAVYRRAVERQAGADGGPGAGQRPAA